MQWTCLQKPGSFGLKVMSRFWRVWPMRAHSENGGFGSFGSCKVVIDKKCKLYTVTVCNVIRRRLKFNG